MVYQRDSVVLTRSRLTEMLDYDLETGVFTWKVDRQGGRGIKPGARAGSVKPTSKGKRYRYIRIDGVDYLAKRLAWFWEKDEWPGALRCLDGNEDNCAIGNLSSYEIVKGPPGSSKKNRIGQRRAYAAKNPDKVRDWHLRSEFGITHAQYVEMSEKQGNLCLICGKPETKERNGIPRGLSVDHCHSTKKIRGLLCASCNVMIGYAKDDIQVLENAVAYLRKNGVA